MSTEEALVAVVAHRLLNSLTSIQGLISTSRALVAADGDILRVSELLELAEQRAVGAAREVHRLACGLPAVAVLGLDAPTTVHESCPPT